MKKARYDLAFHFVVEGYAWGGFKAHMEESISFEAGDQRPKLADIFDLEKIRRDIGDFESLVGVIDGQIRVTRYKGRNSHTKVIDFHELPSLAAIMTKIESETQKSA